MQNPRTPIIGFDAKRANANRTGLGNYSRTVVEALAKLRPQWDFRMYLPKKRPGNGEYEALLRLGNVTEQLPVGGWKSLSSLWRVFGMAAQLRAEGVELFHGLSNELPAGLRAHGIKSVVTIHDVIFLRHPACYKPVDRWIYTLKFRSACRRADRVIAASECTKRDIVEFFGTDPAKIEVVYQGCSPEFGMPVAEQTLVRVREQYALPEHFLLTVGTLEERKNLLLAVKALEHLPEHIHLAAVGRRTKYMQQVEQYARKHGLMDRLHILTGVPFADLPAVYRLAECFVYPSRYEGFGIPIIEAVSASLPVVAATGSCLEETGGAKSLYVSPDDARAMAEAVEHVLNNAGLRAEMVAASQEYIRRFDPARIAEQIAGIYERVLEEK